MIDYGKLYDEFLYDCHIANQRLTEEDWRYYGREEHHIEIPDRDGGLLTPLNSQYLTKYQHWIAGVLQSEVLGKCCFACVTKNVLPSAIELLRLKWAAQHVKDTTTDIPSERRSEATLKGWEVRRNNPDWVTNQAQRSDTARERILRKTPEERSEQSRRGGLKNWENTTPEERSEISRQRSLKRWANKTPEQRSEIMRKVRAGRTRKQQGG